MKVITMIPIALIMEIITIILIVLIISVMGVITMIPIALIMEIIISVMGVITMPNDVSVALHKKLGFEEAAYFKKVNFIRLIMVEREQGFLDESEQGLFD